MNNLIVTGRIGGDIEVKHLSSGSTVTEFQLAIDDGYKDKNTGQRVDKTVWLPCTAFGLTGDNISKFFSKGHGIILQGQLKQDNWVDKESGGNRSKLKMSIQKWDFMICPKSSGQDSSRQGNQQQNSSRQGNQQQNQSSTSNPSKDFDNFDDDIPF